ncbi:hypothetical protein V6N12_057636 [Hibiscus sabdariffa]|uniref:NB-ARC domain-containing protein n=1 Tax=Hibiscus sabdariffa TaxID=183260 RepID=A0ABR2C5U4_9ROSI
MAGALVKRAMSLELAVKELWSCIMSKDVGTVGFYCTPGVEKIRVLVEMYDNLCTKPHVFPFVIWTPVYDDFHVNIPGDLSKKIQDEIGGKIGFTDESWKSKTVEQKAADINEVLSGSRFVLLLDNIWDRVDLKQVGIPEPSHQNGSKLVFITTSLDVSRQMEAREKIKVVRFEPENVWGLFHEKFGHTLLNLNRHQHIPDIENEMSRGRKNVDLPLYPPALCRPNPTH